MTLPEGAERLTTEWVDYTERNHLPVGDRELLVHYVLAQLADPRSDHGNLLHELCHCRWMTGLGR